MPFPPDPLPLSFFDPHGRSAGGATLLWPGGPLAWPGHGGCGFGTLPETGAGVGVGRGVG
jgi:hypothetical protein